MDVQCEACRLGAHEFCDPLRAWCECACGLGGPLDPTTSDEQG